MDNNLEGENPQKQQIAILEMDEDGISAPNWLFEVLAWIARIEMANSQLSFSCKLFKQLCFPKLHGNVKPYKIKQLEFRGDWCTNSGYLRVNCYNKPIPNVPPPPYIAGFNNIYIYFLDAQLLEFVQNILPRLNRIKFSLAIGSRGCMPDNNASAIRSLLELLANKIVKFTFNNYSAWIIKFNRLDFIQKVDYLCACPIPYEFYILINWLALPPTNGQKILELKQSSANETDKFIVRIKEEFSNANKPLNFFIICLPVYHSAPFKLENGKTGEILILYRKDTGIYNIVRCPKGEEDYWNEEGQRKMKDSLDYENANETIVQVEINNIEDWPY